MQRSRSRGKLDDESSDELTTSALLYNVPSIPHQPVRLPSLHSLGAIATEEILRPKTSPDEPEKPLPPIPPKDPFAEQRRHWKSRTTLGTKTTNMKTSSTAEAKRLSKSKISCPVPLDPPSTAIAPNQSRPTTGHTTASAPLTTTGDPEELTRNISNLIQQAVAQEAQTRQKAAIYASESAKLSPLERGKNAFVKATRAIKERLSNNNTSGSSQMPRSSKRPASSRRTPSPDSDLPPEYETPEEIRRTRLERRIAEGENLSNPKIWQLTGNGNIPRKPLPVYESMKSRSRGSGSLDDPFSDGKELESRSSPHDFSGFDFDFSNRKNKGRSIPPSFQSKARADDPPQTSSRHLVVPPHTSRFSSMVSGLAQHSDTEFFSSSPIGYSTPRIRLESQPNPKPNKSTKGALVRSPSVLEFSFEDPSEGTSSSPASPQPRASEGSSMSVKRKGATDDLRSQVAPATKKVKRDSVASVESLGLASGISRMETHDERVPLSPKSANTHLLAPQENQNKLRRGLSIFDVGKGKAPESRKDDGTNKLRPRINNLRKSSLPRPSSMAFHRVLDSRPEMQRLSSFDAGDMDVDELQSDDAAYQVGSKKNC